MIKGKDKNNKELTANNILRLITSWDIFKYYIPVKFSLNQAFSSPFRKDNSPSCSIKRSNTSGEIYFLDYASDLKLNCFKFVMKLFNCNFNEALGYINNHFGLGLENGEIKDFKSIISKYDQPAREKEYKRFDVFVRNFTNEELQYWNLRFLSKDNIKKNNIYSYDKILINGEKQIRTDKISFAYYYSGIDSWKIYTPFADRTKGEYKWLSNVPIDHIEGLNNLKKDKLSIGTKSKKDALITRLFIPETYELQNESNVCINYKNIEYIKDNSLEGYLWFDNDLPGVEACSYYNSFGLKYINIPKVLNAKDQDQFVTTLGLKKFEQFLKDKKLI